MSPDGTSAYASANGPLLIFDRDPLTGGLTQKPGSAGCVASAGSAAEFGCATGVGLELTGAAVTVSPDGKNVYAAGTTVTVFSRDPATGGLTQLPGTGGCVSETGNGGACTDGRGLRGPRSVTLSPDGENVYVASESSDGVAVFDRDPATGALTQKPGTSGCITDDGSPVGDPPPAGQPDTRVRECTDGNALLHASSVAVSADGENAYVTAPFSDAVTTFDRDRATGALQQKPGALGCTAHGGLGGCAYAETLDGAKAVAIAPDGEDVYVASGFSDSVTAFDRDASTGALTQKPGTAGCATETGNGGACTDATGLDFGFTLTVSPDGHNVYVGSWTPGETGVGDALTVFDRSPATGALAQKAGMAGCIGDDGSGAPSCGAARGLAAVTSVVVSPDGRNVYTSAADDSAVAIFDRELAESAPPETAITSGPAEGAATSDGTPTFGFASSEAGSSFRCRIDGGIAFGCGSPVTTAPLAAGAHSFSVAAIDPNGNADPTPATRSFSVIQAASPPAGGRDPTPAPRPSQGGGTITGTSGDDRLVGTPGNDVIVCGAGDDVVLAGGGDDVIDCGAGNDVVDAGAGKDRVSAGSGNDRVGGKAGADRISGQGGGDRLAGGAGADRIAGGSGRDRLSGGGGNDRLSGGGGRDRLLGGGGRDVLLGGRGLDVLMGGPGRDRARQ